MKIKKMKETNFEIIYLFLILISTNLFSACINQQSEIEVITTTTTTIALSTTIETTTPKTMTTTVATTTSIISDCNEICKREGYPKTLGTMSAVECDKNTPSTSSKKWRFQCCCYDDTIV